MNFMGIWLNDKKMLKLNFTCSFNSASALNVLAAVWQDKDTNNLMNDLASVH